MDIKVLKQLCEEYGFQYELWFRYDRIKSKHDVWFIKWNGNKPRLYHQNKLKHIKSGFGMHFQREFKTIYQMFPYIKDHDTKLCRYTYKTQHFKNLINQVQNELQMVK